MGNSDRNSDKSDVLVFSIKAELVKNSDMVIFLGCPSLFCPDLRRGDEAVSCLHDCQTDN